MSGAGDSVPLFTPEELAAMAAGAAEAQREFDAWTAWLQSPYGRAWLEQEAEDAKKMVAEFEAEIAAGKYALSPAELDQLCGDAEVFAEEVRAGKYALTNAELDQLRRDGILAKCHPIKSGGGASE